HRPEPHRGAAHSRRQLLRKVRRPPLKARCVVPDNPMFSDSTPDYDPFLGTRVYNEAAFHQFLAADWARAERLRRCVLLILVSLRRESMQRATLPRSAAASVFLGLSATVRDE